MEVPVGIPHPVIVVKRPRIFVDTAVEAAVIPPVFRLVDHPFIRTVKRGIEYPAFPVGSALHAYAPERLFPNVPAPLLNRTESKSPGFGFEVGTRLFHADIGDTYPEAHLAEPCRGREPGADIAARRRSLRGKPLPATRAGAIERPVGDGIEILAGIIDRFPARNDPVTADIDLAFGSEPEKHVRLPPCIREVEFVKGRPLGGRPLGPYPEILQPHPVRPGMQFLQVMVVPRRGARRVERDVARRGHDRTGDPAPVAGHIEGDTVYPVGKIAVIEPGLGYGVDPHHGMGPVHLRGDGRQQRGHAADIGIDPTAHALVAAGGQGGSEARGKGQE